ncbi:hypothetical protein B0J18DRAFT_422856 [Chaetomium sp. MPI-SDFR-AT-0129]|nr:hypothetical protein B0J18DRAFT_422856 [Chaetomium sp. MPI-SDFR-AT-0129]
MLRKQVLVLGVLVLGLALSVDLDRANGLDAVGLRHEAVIFDCVLLAAVGSVNSEILGSAGVVLLGVAHCYLN